MLAVVQGKQAGAKTDNTRTRRARRSITATNAHVLEVPRAHIGLRGHALETVGLPASEPLVETHPEATAASRDS